MYTTVKQCHVALDYELQQINSNRKQAINPAYYDIALNEAVLQFVETRSSAKGNLKREGFEESQKRYDDLKDLKRRKVISCNVGTLTSSHSKKVYVVLPGDYLKMIPSEVVISYNKRGLSVASTIVTRTVTSYDLSQIVYPFVGLLKVVSGASSIDITNYVKTVKTANGKFYAINVIIDAIRRFGYNVYYEMFDGKYAPETIYIEATDKPLLL